jgi:hypothetical protein
MSRRCRSPSSSGLSAVDPVAVATVMQTFYAKRDGGQLGTTGHRVDGFTPELLSGLTYFGNRLCPFAQRTFWALAEKNAFGPGKFDYVHIDLGANKPAWYGEVSSSTLPPSLPPTALNLSISLSISPTSLTLSLDVSRFLN